MVANSAVCAGFEFPAPLAHKLINIERKSDRIGIN